MRRTDKCSLIQIFALIYLKVLVQIASFFSVKYSSSKVIAKSISRTPKRPQKQSKQHRSSLLLDDVITLRALKRNGYIETATVEMAARYDLRTIRALRAERKKFKLAKRALRPSLRENKRNDFNLLNILKVYWNFYNCLINRKLVLNTPIVPTLLLLGCEEFLLQLFRKL